MSNLMDEALSVLHATGAEYGGGLSNHGPMAAEALVALNRPDDVLDWVRLYSTRLEEPLGSFGRVSEINWKEALGDARRIADWISFFEEELAEAPWPDVVRRWVPRLTPALMAAATHGLIRTGHAVRSLQVAQTKQRLHELAQGLGYWAARYQTLPGAPSSETGGLSPRLALEQVKRIHGPDYSGSGFIFEQIRGLNEEPSFSEVINLITEDGDVDRLLSDVTEVFAGLYLRNDRGVAFVHAVTAPSILRVVAPYLDEADARTAIRYAWQAGAAIYAWFSPDPNPKEAPPMSHDIEPDELIDRAVASTGPHTIKFTEACIRENAINPNPVYFTAARHACDQLGAA